MKFSFILSIVLPIGSVLISIVVVCFIAVRHFFEVRRITKNRRTEYDYQIQKRLYWESGQRVVNEVNSNNNSPRLGENLFCLSARMKQMGISINVDVRGCSENDR